jgi:hypothetical protein
MVDALAPEGNHQKKTAVVMHYNENRTVLTNLIRCWNIIPFTTNQTRKKVSFTFPILQQ